MRSMRPSIDGATLAVLRPYLILAEKLGSLQAQITRGAIQEVNIVYIGEVTSVDTKPLTYSILKGVLTPILGDMVNFVNVPVVVKERNIKVTASSRDEAEDFTNLITCPCENLRRCEPGGRDHVWKEGPAAGPHQ